MFRETVTNTKKEQKIDAIVQILRTIQSSELVSNNSIIYDEFSGIIQRLKEKSFRVVVAGEFSSGKSTFLNAIIGRDLLKHGVQETTATVTEIYNEISCTDTPVLDVYFSDGTVQKGIQASQIMEVTATSSSTHAVAQEIDKVVIRYKILDHAADVCFIDTPGLNGMADKHREKTIEQIKNAHACIYLMQVRGLSSSDIEFLEFICRYQHNVIFVQNFIDELKQLEGETPEE
ncbi:MAG TPA: dynamin family protein, partial [Candidatus Egerieimonas faecigallinarum]|nr:dynamin family protein [Candidatus Egerieimonas faecigallinarum]